MAGQSNRGCWRLSTMGICEDEEEENEPVGRGVGEDEDEDRVELLNIEIWFFVLLAIKVRILEQRKKNPHFPTLFLAVYK